MHVGKQFGDNEKYATMSHSIDFLDYFNGKRRVNGKERTFDRKWRRQILLGSITAVMILLTDSIIKTYI